MKRLRLPRLRISFFALCLATLGWAAGCATPQPMVDPYFAARSYTPNRIAVMPPTVFVVYDEVGTNDPRKSQALSQEVGTHMGSLLTTGLQRRGYEVVNSIGWDGVRATDGSYALSGQDLGWMANSIVQFSSSPAGGGSGTMPQPFFIAPELAQRVGGVTGADSLMYVNVKGVAVSPGKRSAQVMGVVFFVVIVAAIVLLLIAESKGGKSGGREAGPVASGGGGAPRTAQGWRGGSSAVTPGAGAATTARVAPPAPRGYGAAPDRPGPVYTGPHVGLGVGVVVPLEGHAHTHEGQVREDDETFAGDQAYLSATLVSTYDGRVLWHARQSIDVALDEPQDVQRMVERLVETIPPSLSRGAQVPAARK
jgi:hypothetical protein